MPRRKENTLPKGKKKKRKNLPDVAVRRDGVPGWIYKLMKKRSG